MSSDEKPASAPGTAAAKSHPCDQCRRRKVRCDSGAPCDRCTQSGLRCTRDIARKRRGPKKGSGSVIAKLRDETEHSLQQNAALPPYILPPLTADNGLPGLYRTTSGDSIFSSASSNYVPRFAPTSNPQGFEPCSVPAENLPEIAPNTQLAPLAIDIDSPFSWQLGSRDPYTSSQYPSPGSSLGGYLTVNELAHRIFVDGDPSLVYNVDNANGAAGPSGPPQDLSNSGRHTPVDGLPSTAAESAQSTPYLKTDESPVLKGLQRPFNLPTSNLFQVETQVVAIAAEVGVSPNLVSQCVKQYYHHLYPIMPAIHEATFYRRLNQGETLASEEKCLLLSLCAVVMVNAPPSSDLNFDAKKDIARQLLFHVAHLRRKSDWTESPNLTTIIVSFFIAITYFELKQYRSHHFFLREAVGMALEQELHVDATYSKLSHTQRICYQRMFALLFMTERGFAIFRNKPILINRLPFLPTEYFDDEDPSILVGFQCLCQLFRLLDEKFVELWRDSAPELDGSQIYVQNITAIQHQLNAMSFEMGDIPDIQAADVLITQQWLRLIFWQASMRQGLVSSTANDPVFFYNYPIEIAKTLCEVMSKLPMDAIIVHGAGIVSLTISSY